MYIMTDINIVELIETNPITNLSQNYNIKILEKIQQEFSNFEQRLFISSFYCYLNYDSDDFIIDLDNIWNWLGFGQKVNAKRMLLKNFIENKDYIKLESTLNDTIHRIKGGQNKEIFMLNISSFKKFCLKAGTQKADEIHDYYIKLEKIIHYTIDEERKELRLQLQNSLKTSDYEKKKAIEQTLINQFPLNTECIYFGIIDNTNDNNEKLIKFGHTNNLNVRVMDHRNKYNNFILVEAYKVQNKVEIENLIKAHSKIKKQIRNIIVNDKMKTEIIAYNETNFTINDLKKYIKEIINSRTYSIERFNKLLQDNQDLSDRNEELLNINQELKEELKKYDSIITRQTIDIQTMRETIEKQNILLSENDDVIEKQIEEEKINENIIIYKNTLLPNDETTNRFNEFIDTMCIVRKDVEESSINMEGSFRIWNGVKPKKEIFHLLKAYLDTRFKPARISNQNKNQVVHGYIGVKLKPVQYVKKLINNDVETFLFEVCNFTPNGKILNTTLSTEFKRWKQQLGKEICDDDIIKIKEYLNNCEYALKATVYIDKGSNEGYYGIQLKNDEPRYKTTSSTGKKVEKVDNKTEIVLRTWETIAKAAEDEKISAAKMSRSIKNKTIFNDDYYYRCSS
jgi:hypothetical protein